MQKDKIYKIDATQKNLKELKTTQKLPEGSEIVCQAKAIKDTLGKNVKGYHHYVEVTGDKREFHSYNDLFETGYYENMIWEKGKGLIKFESGYGATREGIEIDAPGITPTIVI